MPLVMQRDGPYAVPRLLCDHCGTVIRTATDGKYQWSEAMLEDDTATAMFFTHKECCHTFDTAQSQEHLVGANDLDHFMVFLSNNVGLDWEKATKAAALIASME